MADDGRDPALRSGDTLAELAVPGAQETVEPLIAETPFAEDHTSLLKALQGDILPRLLMLYTRQQSPDRPAKTSGQPDHHKIVEEFTHILCQDDAKAAREYIENVMDTGIETVDLFVNVLAPAARKLGRLWEHDLCTFTDVTLGLMRIQSIFRHYEAALDAHAPGVTSNTPSILLSSLYGDQHTFGLMMISDLFRRDGWIVSTEQADEGSMLVNMIAASHVDVVGLSLAREVDVEMLKADISNIRQASQNTFVRILVGGSYVTDNPAIAGKVGADLALIDAETAPQAARGLLVKSANRC